MTARNPVSLLHRGINYGPGLHHLYGERPLKEFRQGLVSRDIRVIRDELHCNSVNVYGSDIGALAENAAIAHDAGLDVWLQPRLVDATPAELLEQVAHAAQLAEELRPGPAEIVLNVGCELSLYTAGIIPGGGFQAKGFPLDSPRWWPLLPLFNRRLNLLLTKVAATARANFGGRITYASGLWEKVDWTAFDIVGVNYYRHRFNHRTYTADLRMQHRHGKPVAILEFGCGAYRGADEDGPRAHGIIDWGRRRPRISGPWVRDEQTQARYLAELLDIYTRERVSGAFVFEFNSPELPHFRRPGHDLDMGSYSIVKVRQRRTDSWEPKAAFHEVARIYRKLRDAEDM